VSTPWRRDALQLEAGLGSWAREGLEIPVLERAFEVLHKNLPAGEI
jgi:hypothetical protein